MYKAFIKPFFDILIAFLLLVILSPVIIFTAILLLVFQSGSPFFTQRRPGKNSKIFTIIKFRTMNNKRDSSGRLLPDAQRLTSFGRFVRSTSLDELPQLFNVLKGDMSLVGPRPLLPEYLPLYSDFQGQRHDVKPGITGYAQVNGRNAVSWEKKFELDVYYVKNCSFALDVNIILKTILKVVKRDDINAENAVTTRPFTGNQNS